MKIKPKQANALIKQNQPSQRDYSAIPQSAIEPNRQLVKTRNVQVGFFLIECPHVKILRNYDSMFCHYCQSEIVGNSVGNLLVSLDRDGFLEAKGPLKVR